MSPAPGDEAPPARRWQAALALAWAAGCGVLYARMVVVERLPGVAQWLGLAGE